MQLKTFRAADLPSALARARAECGPDALVLATNEIQGRLGLTTIEITVAIDRDPQPEADELRRLSREMAGPEAPRRDTAASDGSQRSLLRRLARHVADRASETTTHTRPATGAPDPALRSAVDALVSSGLSADLALRFARAASTRPLRRHDGDALSDAAERGMLGLLRFAPPRLADGSVVFVVGPPGAGKTSTVLKLATRLADEGRGPVVIADADADADDPHGDETSRMRRERLARRHGVLIERIDGVDDLRRIVTRQAGRGITLVDTSGIGAADEDRRRALARICRSVLESEVLLVIPAGLHREEVRRIARRFGALHPTAAVMSRVDDGGLLGEVVSGVADIDLPLALLCTGRRVPTDLEDASPRRLAALLLRSGFDRGAETTESPA